MCISCFSNGEVWAANAAAVTGIGNQLADRLRGRRSSPALRLQRRQAAWDKDAEFLSSLGHDAVICLGPRPVEPQDGAT